MVAASKKPANGKEFEQSYPFTRPTSGMRGGVKGIFANLEILVGVAIATSQGTECLTGSDKGMFHRSGRTLNKIESLNIENKTFKLVLSMFTLFLNLMLDVTESLSQGMGNLLRVQYSLLLRSNS